MCVKGRATAAARPRRGGRHHQQPPAMPVRPASLPPPSSPLPDASDSAPAPVLTRRLPSPAAPSLPPPLPPRLPRRPSWRPLPTNVAQMSHWQGRTLTGDSARGGAGPRWWWSGGWPRGRVRQFLFSLCVGASTVAVPIASRFASPRTSPCAAPLGARSRLPLLPLNAPLWPFVFERGGRGERRGGATLLLGCSFSYNVWTTIVCGKGRDARARLLVYHVR